MSEQSLTSEDFEVLNGMLVRYGNELSIQDVSELDGFLTAILMGPQEITPVIWLPAIWGGMQNMPQWEDQAKAERFMQLCTQMQNEVSTMLANNPKDYAALFGAAEIDGQEMNIVDKWCSGFMRGVTLGNWTELPEDIQPWLNIIALIGLIENQAVLSAMDERDYQSTIQNIEPAVRALYFYWQSQASSALND